MYSSLFFLIFLARGPEEGLSEYRVQKTHAGTSFPLGPRTIPGGQSASLVTPGGASLRLGDPGLVSSGDVDRVFEMVLGEDSLSGLTGGDSDMDLGTVLRMLSMEKGSVDFGLVSLL